MESFFLSETCKYLYLVGAARSAQGMCALLWAGPGSSAASDLGVEGARSGEQMHGCTLCEVWGRSGEDPRWYGGRGLR